MVCNRNSKWTIPWGIDSDNDITLSTAFKVSEQVQLLDPGPIEAYKNKRPLERNHLINVLHNISVKFREIFVFSKKFNFPLLENRGSWKISTFPMN